MNNKEPDTEESDEAEAVGGDMRPNSRNLNLKTTKQKDLNERIHHYRQQIYDMQNEIAIEQFDDNPFK